VVDVKTWTVRQPGADFCTLVNAVVEDEQIHVENGWDILINSPQETHELLGRCLSLHSANTEPVVATSSGRKVMWVPLWWCRDGRIMGYTLDVAQHPSATGAECD